MPFFCSYTSKQVLSNSEYEWIENVGSNWKRVWAFEATLQMF